MEPTAQQFHFDKNRMSTSDWMISIFIASLPLVGIIMLFVWTFSNNVPETKANWAKAMLLWTLILIVLGIVMMTVMEATSLGARLKSLV